MLQSNRVVNLQKAETFCTDLALTPSSFLTGSPIDCRGFSTLILRVTSISAGTLKLTLRGNILYSGTEIMPFINRTGNVGSPADDSYMDTEDIFYTFDVSKQGYVGIYCESSNTAATVSIDYSLTNMQSGFEMIENRTKVIQIKNKIQSMNANDAVTVVYTDIDVSRFAYVIVRVRSRETGANTYETRDFTVKFSWKYTYDPTFSGSITGAGKVSTILDTTSDYDLSSDWVPVKSPYLDVFFYNGETSAKEYEVDIIGVR
jgi:hypothetical protein